uniref:AAA+ ATPase domain-containing protein n=1 Tax=viral metagenome TaxID=1070528 RepID=A0A6C0K5J6_9ZZZZ
MENLGLPIRIQNLLTTVLECNNARSHMIMIGPPGSGKTTSVKYFVNAMHGKKSTMFGRVLFLNSSDERGLDAVRNRVYPFIRSSFNAFFPTNNEPKVIIFDEAETLTDQAQIALRPLLDESTDKILVIFLCNSISRIHNSILHKFLIVPFEAPKMNDFNNRMKVILNNESFKISGIDILFRRGDIRFFILNSKKINDCAKIWNDIFTTHATLVNNIFVDLLQKWTFPDVAMFCIFCAKYTNTINKDAMLHMLEISDTDFVKNISNSHRAKLLSNWVIRFVKQKLEGNIRTK